MLSEDEESLVAAVKTNNAAEVKRLLKQKKRFSRTPRISPNIVTDGQTILFYAARKNLSAIVEHLIAAKVDVKQGTSNGITPLYIACQEGHTLVVGLLIVAGAYDIVGQVDGSPVPAPLLVASQKGHVEIATLLLNARANINEKYRGATSLYLACQNGRKKMVGLLIRRGADINAARDRDGKTPLFIALQKDHTEIAELLFDKGADLVNKVQDDGVTLLYLASQHGLAKIVEALIATGVNVNEVCDGVTPLYIASQNGHADVVKLLADAGASIDETNTADGVTSLCIAIQNGHTEVVRLLLDKGADANKARTVDGVTPLCIASQNDNAEIAGLLIAAGANVEKATNDGATPLSIAEQQGNEAVAGVLRQEIQRLEDERRAEAAEAEGEKAAEGETSGLLLSPKRLPFRRLMVPPAFTPIVEPREFVGSDEAGYSLDFQDTAESSTEEPDLTEEVSAEIQSEKHCGIAMATCIACLAGIILIPLGVKAITNDDKIIGCLAGLVGITLLVGSPCLYFARRKRRTTAVGVLPTDSYQEIGGEGDISPINSDQQLISGKDVEEEGELVFHIGILPTDSYQEIGGEEEDNVSPINSGQRSVVNVKEAEDVEEEGGHISQGLAAAAPKRREHRKPKGAAAEEIRRPLLGCIDGAPYLTGGDALPEESGALGPSIP